MPFRPLLPIAHLPLEDKPFTVPRFTLLFKPLCFCLLDHLPAVPPTPITPSSAWGRIFQKPAQGSFCGAFPEPLGLIPEACFSCAPTAANPHQSTYIPPFGLPLPDGKLLGFRHVPLSNFLRPGPSIYMFSRWLLR